jgi:ribosome-associated protein
MEPESVQTDSDTAFAEEIARFLHDAGALNVVALDISGPSAFADAFVIAGATSQGQLQGFYRRTEEFLLQFGVSPKNHRKRGDESGWLLLDCGGVVIHLMLKEIREFYEIEKIWYDAAPLWNEEMVR